MSTPTDTPRLELLRPPPAPGHLPEHTLRTWRARFDELWQELRLLGGEVPPERTYDLLELPKDPAMDPLARRPKLDAVFEFAACHVRGPRGSTVAECAGAQLDTLPEPMRPVVAGLAGSYWDLYEPVAASWRRGLVVRRLCDAEEACVRVVEQDQPLVRGQVVALRRLDGGRFAATTTPLQIEARRLAELVGRLETEPHQMGAWPDRPAYMRERGSALILSAALASRWRDLTPDRDPIGRWSEAVVDYPAAEPLRDAVGRLEALMPDDEPLALTHPCGTVIRIARDGQSCLVHLFDSVADLDRFERRGRYGACQPPLVRLWREPAHGDRPAGLHLHRRDADGLWQDPTGEVYERLLAMLRFACRTLGNVDRAA